MEEAGEDSSGLCSKCAMVDSATLALDASAVIDPVLGQSILQSLELPGFELLHIVGEGGMGAVVAARRLDDDSQVAVKVLPPSLSQNTSLVRRFQREADAMDKLRHPHIVGIIARGRSGPFLYFIMEYVLGPEGRPVNLRQQCAAGLPSEANVLRWATQIVDALGYAHAKGIIHRDIKPSNILLDEKGEAKVADFGVASATFDASATVITRATSAVGTPLYMAPEQYADPKKIDHRVDVYSVGMLLYELLTGDLPLGVYDPPTHRRPGLNPTWDKIVGRALQSDPQRRFADMASFRDALTRLEKGEERDTAPSVVFAGELHCPSCKNAVRPADAVCRTCSHPLFAHCPECGATNTRINLACVACNIDLVPLWKVRRLWESADELLERANGEGEPAVLQQCAERAISELTQASRLSVHADQSLARLEAAGKTTAALSWRCAQLALEAKDLSSAMHYCRRVLAYSPKAEAPRRTLDRCEARRRSILETSQEHVAGKRLKTALEELQTGAMLFPKDEEIRAELTSLRERVSEASLAVRDRLPRLERAKKYREIAVLVDRLERIGVPAKPLIGVKRRTYEALAKAAQHTVEARALADTHTFTRARAAVNKALAIVADDQDAREVLAAIDRHEKLLGGAADDIETAMSDGRWVYADRLLDQVLAAAKEPKGAVRRGTARPYGGLFVEIASKIDAGLHRSEVFRRLLLVAFGGLFVWLAATACVVQLGESLPKGSASSGTITAFLFGFLASGLLSFLSLVARRTWPTFKEALAAVFNGAVLAAAYSLLTRLDPTLLDDRFPLWALSPWNRPVAFEVGVAATLATAFVSTFVAGLVRHAIGAGPRPNSVDLVGGLAVVAVCWATSRNVALVGEAPFFLAAVGVAALAGSRRPYVDYFSLASLALVAVLAVGAGRAAGPNGLLVGRAVELAALAGMLVVATPKPIRWESLAPSAAGLLVLFGLSWKYPPQEFVGLWLSLGVFLHATGVYALRSRLDWEPRLHLADRYGAKLPSLPFGWTKTTPQSA
jgi:hypothetical protein